MNLRAELTELYVGRLAASREGRAFLLSQVAEAEGAGESAFFEPALRDINDAELRKLVERHQADEARHELLFRDRLDRTGVDPGPVPVELRYVAALSRAAAPEGALESYLLLQVVEERAIGEMRIFERAFRPHDAKTADAFAAVADDEHRHLKYCHAVLKRCARGPAARCGKLRELRRLEAASYGEHLRANIQRSLTCGYIQAGLLEKFFWRTLRLATAGGSSPFLDFSAAAA